jgi:hypothetical protein
MNSQWSGAIIYEWTNLSGFGLVDYGSFAVTTGTPTTVSPDFTNLQKQWATLTPTGMQTDRSLSTQGSITNPKNKPCPTPLKPWTDFPELQQQLFERTYEYIPLDTELFTSTQYFTGLGQDICDRPLAMFAPVPLHRRLT